MYYVVSLCSWHPLHVSLLSLFCRFGALMPSLHLVPSVHHSCDKCYELLADMYEPAILDCRLPTTGI